MRRALLWVAWADRRDWLSLFGRGNGGRYPFTMSVKRQDRVRGAEDIGDFGRSQEVRREAVLALSMSERLARMHSLCKQMSAIKGAASAR
jgi:hypothetical protein